jgi:hypothetical protein
MAPGADFSARGARMPEFFAPEFPTEKEIHGRISQLKDPQRRNRW